MFPWHTFRRFYCRGFRDHQRRGAIFTVLLIPNGLHAFALLTRSVRTRSLEPSHCLVMVVALSHSPYTHGCSSRSEQFRDSNAVFARVYSRSVQENQEERTHVPLASNQVNYPSRFRCSVPGILKQPRPLSTLFLFFFFRETEFPCFFYPWFLIIRRCCPAPLIRLWVGARIFCPTR